MIMPGHQNHPDGQAIIYPDSQEVGRLYYLQTVHAYHNIGMVELLKYFLYLV